MRARKAPYDRLIDEETWAFIDRTDSFYPPDAVTRSIDEQRAVYDAMCLEFHAGYPDGVTATDREIAGVPCRAYAAGGSEALVLYLHGGGFVVGGRDSHDDVCAELCARTGLDVIAVDYRLCPEHPHPAAYDDCRAVYMAIAEGRRVVLVGDSAGGNLCAALAHTSRPNAPKGQVLIYPGLGGDPHAGSYIEHADAPLLTRDDIVFYQGVRTGGAPPPDEVAFAPLSDSDYSGLPPTVVFSAECDPLADDGEVYRDRILAAGGKAHWIHEEGLVHGYLRARHTAKRARGSFGRIVAAVDALAKGDWPY